MTDDSEEINENATLILIIGLILIMFVVFVVVVPAVVLFLSDSPEYTESVSCSLIDYANESAFDGIVHYQNLSSDNQILFKKAINGTRVGEASPSQSMFLNPVKYKNDLYDCEIPQIGA